MKKRPKKRKISSDKECSEVESDIGSIENDSIEEGSVSGISESYLVDQDNYNVDDFVLVTFAKKRRVTYCIGQVLDTDEVDNEVQTRFLQ